MAGDDPSRASSADGKESNPSSFSSHAEWTAHVEGLIVDARRAMEAKNWQDAAVIYERAHSLAPENVPLLANWAVALDWLDRNEEAAALLEQAILLKPRYSYLHGLLGLEFWKLGAFDKAEKAYRRATRLGRGTWRYHVDLAELLRAMDRPTDALQVYAEAVESEQYADLAGQVERNGDPAAMWQAIADGMVEIWLGYRSGFHTVPPDPPLEQWFHLLEPQLQMGNFAGTAEALTILAEAALEMEYNVPAASFSRQALHLKPGFARAAVVTGIAWTRMGRVADAIDLLMKTEQKTPDDAPLLEMLGDSLMAASRLDEAIERYRRAAELDAQSTALRQKLAAALEAKARARAE